MEWLGFRFRLCGQRLRVRLGEHAFAKLAGRFRLAHAKGQSAERENAVLRQWAGQFGPCSRWEDGDEVCGRAVALAREFGFVEDLPETEMARNWVAAAARWERTRRRARRAGRGGRRDGGFRCAEPRIRRSTTRSSTMRSDQTMTKPSAWGLTPVATLLKNATKPSWLVDGVMAENQPMVIGGRTSR